MKIIDINNDGVIELSEMEENYSYINSMLRIQKVDMKEIDKEQIFVNFMNNPSPSFSDVKFVTSTIIPRTSASYNYNNNFIVGLGMKIKLAVNENRMAESLANLKGPGDMPERPKSSTAIKLKKAPKFHKTNSMVIIDTDNDAESLIPQLDKKKKKKGAAASQRHLSVQTSSLNFINSVYIKNFYEEKKIVDSAKKKQMKYIHEEIEDEIHNHYGMFEISDTTDKKVSQYMKDPCRKKKNHKASIDRDSNISMDKDVLNRNLKDSKVSLDN